MRDYTDKPPLCECLCSVSFGSQGSQGSSGSTSTSQQGLNPEQSKQLSGPVTSGLQQLYNLAQSHLMPTQPLTPAYRITNDLYGNNPQYGGILSTDIPNSVYNNVTGAYLGPSATTAGNFTGSLVPNTSADPIYHQFSLPSLDQNGLYGGQTSAVDALLNKAYGNLNTTGAGGQDVMKSSLAALLPTIGQQTEQAVTIPENVRQQNVQDVNSVLQLMSAALGGSSSGSSFNTSSGSGMNSGFASGMLKQLILGQYGKTAQGGTGGGGTGGGVSSAGPP